YAQAQVLRIQDTAARTRRYPRIGRPVPEFPEESWRELLAGSYRVIYELNSDETEVRILAVVHGRRLLRRSLVV
ncbi:MAG: type II toxin-antitoxin system RelE/ParE family toxin, partial [Actinomycetia bacterium]|nr:type II toxin-antitoxin system RelE/ParE family toxin [Actinomycetes bacterium]